MKIKPWSVYVIAAIALAGGEALAGARPEQAPIAPGSVLCMVGDTVNSSPAVSVWPVSTGALAYRHSVGSGVTLSTCPSIANLGADAEPFGVPEIRAAVICTAGEARVVYAGTASAAGLARGVMVWRDEVTGEVYISTLACRVRRFE